MAETTRSAGGRPAPSHKSGGTTPASKTAAPKPVAARAPRRGAPPAQPAAGAERWLFAVVGAGDVAAGTIRHTAERTRTLFTGGRKEAAANTSATVDRLAVRGRSVMGEVTGSESVRAVTERAGLARRRLGALSESLGKAASNAVEAGKAFRRAS